jgi:glucose-6-phosphate 1-epimerase
VSTTSGHLADGTVHETRGLGAQVLRWQPPGHEPVLFAGERLPDVHPAHMGVPVVMPWFGNGPDGDLTPSHGYARQAPWTRLHLTTRDSSVEVAYRLDHETASGVDGFDAERGLLDATLDASFGEALTLALTVTNAGRQVAEVELALHTYLRVGDVEQVRLSGLEDAAYVDKTATGGPAWREADGEPLTVRGEVDRVYDSAGAVRVDDPVLGRVLTVSKEGSGSTVVWSPGESRGEALTDLAPGEWRRFVCVEAAAVGAHAVTLAPGAAHVLTTRVEVARPGDVVDQED